MGLRMVLPAVFAAACNGSDCVEVSTSCTPQYDPTFDQVYANTLSTTCAISGCHAGSIGRGDLAMGNNQASAYRALAEFVQPGDPGCSRVVEDLEPDDSESCRPGRR